jgi:hypothetical protein
MPVPASASAALVFQFLCLGCAVSAASVNGFAPVLGEVRHNDGCIDDKSGSAKQSSPSTQL